LEEELFLMRRAVGVCWYIYWIDCNKCVRISVSVNVITYQCMYMGEKVCCISVWYAGLTAMPGNGSENSESTKVYELEMSRTFCSWPGTHDDIFVTWPFVYIYIHIRMKRVWLCGFVLCSWCLILFTLFCYESTFFFLCWSEIPHIDANWNCDGEDTVPLKFQW
jgi:hypothetical protein